MFGPFKLKKTVGRSYNVDLTDIAPLKRGLKHLGYYKPPAWGITEHPDEPLFDGIERLQADQGLTRDGVMKPKGPTATRVGQLLADRWKAENGGMGAQSEGGGIPGPEESGPNPKHPFPAWPGFKPGQGPRSHHDRNKYQSCPSKAPKEGDPDWSGSGASAFHCGYDTRRGRTGGPTHGHQCVYRKDGKLVTDPECRGSYDYQPPYDEKGNWIPGRGGRHFMEDVWPWIKYGN